jgi:hypothetical protein
MSLPRREPHSSHGIWEAGAQDLGQDDADQQRDSMSQEGSQGAKEVPLDEQFSKE